MDVSIDTLRYDTELIAESGIRYQLNLSVCEVEWEDCKNELAQRATIKLGNHKIDGVNLAEKAKLGCLIQIGAHWDSQIMPVGAVNWEGKTLDKNSLVMFSGCIWEWRFVNSTNKDVLLQVYDPLIRLQKSKDQLYYHAGMTTQAIIGDICRIWGIPLVYSWGRSITHGSKAFRGIAVSDMIIELLEEVHKQTGGDYIIRFRPASLLGTGSLVVSGYGTNERVYIIESDNTIMTDDRLTLNNLVTRVKIIGVAKDEERSSVEAIVDGNLKFGVLQEVIRRDDSSTLAQVKAEADTILKNRGKPEEITSFNAPDVPEIRKGDRIELRAGNLRGEFFVLAITHNATTKRMNVTVTRAANINTSVNTAFPVPLVSADFHIGKIVHFKGGPHHYTSMGDARGGTRISGLAVITHMARGANFPIHLIGGAYRTNIGGSSNVYGWVSADLVEAR
jgi:hypothetical protein